MSYGRFKFRRDTAANWTSVNPVLAAGEIALETDTSPYRVKIGNGSTAWVSLDYWAIAAADITDSTTVGRAVLTAANAAAARTAIGAGTGNGTSNFSGVYSDLTGKPTLGTASALNVAASGNAAAGEVVRGDDTRLGTGGSFTGGALTSALDEAKGADIARATTTNIGAATGNFVHLTGTTTVTGLGTVQAGTRRIVRFAGAGTLTHNATSLILPGAANITTAANDCAIFVSEGSGNWRCVAYSKANGQAVVVTAPTITGFTASLNTASPNNTINAARLLVTGGTTDGDVIIQPKGLGSVLAQLPDSSTAGGNKRGSNAVDFQTIRSAATQVASGDYSVVCGGYRNTASGNSSLVAGNENVASGTSAFAMGQQNIASGGWSVAVGQQCIADSSRGQAHGYMASTRSVDNIWAHACGSSFGEGTLQGIRLPLRASSPGTTSPFSLTTDGGTKTAINHYVLPDRCTSTVRGEVTARTQTGDAATWIFQVAISREANAAATSVLSAATITSLGTSGAGSSWSLAVVADTTNGSLDVRVTCSSGAFAACFGYLTASEVTRA